MAARTDDINKKTNKLAEENPRKGKEMQQYNEVENQLQMINAERQNNLALEKQDLGTEAQMTETLSQAGAMAASGVGGGAAAASFTPQTQATLGKYGLQGEPRTVRSSTHDVRVQPNNITINNTTNTTTTNNIQTGVGPLQGRPVQFLPQQSPEAQGQAKFKTWLTNLFAQQKEANLKRTKEYEKREWSLTRSANKMLRKMQDVGKDVMGTFNPKNIGTTVGNQMRVLLMLFGIKFLAKNFDRIVEIGTGVYHFLRDSVNYFGITKEGKALVARGGGLRGDLIRFLGGDPKDPKVSLMSVFKDIFGELSDHIKLYFEKQMAMRGMAMKAIKFPDLKIGGEGGGGWIGDLVGKLGNVFSKAFSGVTTYLGDILTALVDPKAGIQRSIRTEINTTGERESTAARKREGEPSMFTNHGDINSGDHALVETGKNGQRKYSILANALDASGNLENTAGAYISQGSDILGAMNDAAKYGRYDVARLTSGLSRLEESAMRNGQVTVDKEFLDKVYGPTNAQKLVQSGQIKKVRMKFVEEEMSTRDKYLEQIYANEKHGDETYLGNVARNSIAIPKAVWRTVVQGDNVWDASRDMLNDMAAMPINGIYQSWKRGREEKDKKLVLVPADDPRPAATLDGRVTTEGDYYQLTPQALSWLATNIFKSKGGFNPSDQTFISGATFKLSQVGGGKAEMNKKWNLRGKDQFQSQYDVDLNGKFAELQHLTNLEAAYDDRLNNDAWSRRTATIGNNFGNAINSAVNWAGGLMSGAGRALGITGGTKRITRAESKKNAAYIMNYLTKKKGLQPHQAAGIVGNLMAESGLNPSSNAIDTNGLRAGGLAAWNGPLWEGLHSYARQQGKPWNNIDLQLDYLWNLLGRDNKQMNDVRARLAAAKTPYDASDAWAYYERYAGYNYDPRTARQAGWSVARIQREHDNRGANANGAMALWNEINGQEGGVSSYLGSSFPSGGFAGQIDQVAPNFTSGSVSSGETTGTENTQQQQPLPSTGELVDNGSGFYVPQNDYSPQGGIGDAWQTAADNLSGMQVINTSSPEEMAKKLGNMKLVEEAAKLWTVADRAKIKLMDPTGKAFSEKGFVEYYSRMSDAGRKSISYKVGGMIEANSLYDSFDENFIQNSLAGRSKSDFRQWYKNLDEEKRADVRYQVENYQRGVEGYENWRNQFSPEELKKMAALVNATNIHGGIDSDALKGVYNSVLNGNFYKRSNLTQEQKNFAASILQREQFSDFTKKIKDLENRVASAPNYEERSDRQFELDRLKYQRSSLGRKDMLAQKGDDLATLGRLSKNNKQISDIDLKLADIEYKKANFRKYFNASTRGMENLSDEALLKMADEMWAELEREEEEVAKHLEEVTGLSAERIKKYREDIKAATEKRIKHEEFTKQSMVDLQSEFDKLSKNGQDYLGGVLKMFEKYGEDALKFLGLTLSDMEKSYKRTKDLMYDKLEGWQQQMEIETDLKLGKITPEEAKELRQKAFAKAFKSPYDNLFNVDTITAGGSVFVKDNATRAAKAANKKAAEGNKETPLMFKPVEEDHKWIGKFGSKAEGGWTPDGPVNIPFKFAEGGNIEFHNGEYVVPKYLAQVPEVRVDIDKWERYRTSTVAAQKTADGKMKEPQDFTSQMIGRQDTTNELLGLIVKTNANGFAGVANAAASGGKSDIPQGIKPAYSHKHSYEQ